MLTIITDSSANISPAEAESLGVKVMPLSIEFGTREYRDGIDIDCDGFYRLLVSEKTFPHTSQLTYGCIEGAVKEALASADEALILPISSALSGSYDRCREVAAGYKNVSVCDLKCTTVMLKMLVEEGAANRDKSAAEVADLLLKYRQRIKLYAALDTIEYLGKGGRIPKAAAAIGTAFRVKPVVTVNAAGEVEVLSKQFGMPKAMSYVCSRVAKDKIDFSKPVFCIYTMDDFNSLKLMEKSGVGYTRKENICPVIGAHIGPRAAGIVYAEKISPDN